MTRWDRITDPIWETSHGERAKAQQPGGKEAEEGKAEITCFRLPLRSRIEQSWDLLPSRSDQEISVRRGVFLMVRKEETSMLLYMFVSQTRPELHAFADDASGSKLPEKFGPWTGTGVVRPDRAPPHRFSRATIEEALADHGFQLWRTKSAIKKPAARH
jgi:hypothetical protein